MSEFFKPEDFEPAAKLSFDEAKYAAGAANIKVAGLVAEVEKLRRLTTEPDHGNEYAIVCHYKDVADQARADLAALKLERENAPVVYRISSRVWDEIPGDGDTHTARLVDVKEIK